LIVVQFLGFAFATGGRNDPSVLPQDLRIALFSGNYNYVRDGANQALNRLVGFLLKQGASVRVYSPTTDTPAFEPAGDLVSLPSVSIPGRAEYRLSTGLPRGVRDDLAAFKPNILHISSPDIAAHRAVTWARHRKIPVIASVHTRFETYLSYYNLQSLEPVVRAIMRRIYRRCDALLVPAESTAAVLRAQRMNKLIYMWTRGVDRVQFNPARRDIDWRRSLGIGDDELAVMFLGRLVLEKGLDVFVETINLLAKRGVRHRPLVIGDGPARGWFEQHMPAGIFVGQQIGTDLARAVASSDVFLNPSVTEAFGNVTLEAMACALPVVAAAATGATNIVRDGETGILVEPGDIEGFASALEAYARDPGLRRQHGEAGLAYAKTQDWDEINGAVLKAYLRVIERRERIARLTRR
jgi:glycosyltransferase involved in cell wall biosynthesis